MMTSLFELVCNGENAFHITVTQIYTIDFIRAPEIQSILGFESSVLKRELTTHDDTSWVLCATK